MPDPIETDEERAAYAAAIDTWGESIDPDDIYDDPRHLIKSAAVTMWRAGRDWERERPTETGAPDPAPRAELEAARARLRTVLQSRTTG